MPWYGAGSVAVTNGSTTVTGAGTDFVSNVNIGDAFNAPDRGLYEIAQVVSATQLLLAKPYQGSTAGGQGYSITPTQKFAKDLANGFGEVLNTFGAVRDGIGQGFIPDGSLASPALRFSADQDTGIRRVGANAIALVTGGVDRLVADTNGGIAIGGYSPTEKVHVYGNIRLDAQASKVAYAPADVFAIGGDSIASYGMTVGAALGGGNIKTVLAGYGGVVFGAGGSERARIDQDGNVGIGTSSPAGFGGYTCLTVGGAGHGYFRLTSPSGTQSLVIQNNFGGVGPAISTASAHPLLFGVDSAERMRVDVSGNFLVGATAEACHTFRKLSPEGSKILVVDNAISGVEFQASNGGGANAAAASVKLPSNTSTGRSLAAAGTINASGADYAEYMLKAAGCGIIAKGDVCGVDRDGKLTKTWADAISFVIKSTDPSLVGADTWAAHLRTKPEQPGAEPQAPTFPAVPADDADEASIAAWTEAQASYPALLATYQTEHAAWQQTMDAYAADLAAWNAELEIARAPVDRIAFCGQVPCNVTGDFAVGDYIIAAANGAGIKAVAVKPDEITLAQYMRRIGKVWAIREGRAWIDVQHG